MSKVRYLKQQAPIPNAHVLVNRQYSLPVGEFMFFQFADVLICQSRADYYTLDEWAKYLGKLLKPLVVR